MLETILLTVGFFLIAMAAMAVGVAVTGRRLAGSCGGTAGAACRCSPEKRAACAEKATQTSFSPLAQAQEEFEPDDELPDIDPLARPGEERLIQLGRR